MISGITIKKREYKFFQRFQVVDKSKMEFLDEFSEREVIIYNTKKDVHTTKIRHFVGSKHKSRGFSRELLNLP